MTAFEGGSLGPTPTKIPAYTREMHEEKLRAENEKKHHSASRSPPPGKPAPGQGMKRKRLPDSWGDRAWEDSQ